MFRRVLSCMLLLLFVCLTGTALGQVMLPGKWWRVPQISERLDLSADEKTQIEDLFFQNRRKLLQYKRTLEQEQVALEAMLDRTPLNEATVAEKLKDLEEARTNLATERFRFILEVRKILGLERFQRLKAICREMLQKGPSPNRLQGVPRWRSWLRFW
jgi:Spy/CpxP family protein refolding chaperone